MQRCSIRQRNAKKEIVRVFQALVFKVSLAAMDPRIRSSADQKIVKLGASWFPSLIKRKRKPVRQSGFQGAAPDGHKFVLLLFQHLRQSRVDVEINDKDIQRHKLPSCVSSLERPPWPPLWPQCCSHFFFHLILCGKRAGDVKRVPGSVHHATVNKGARPLMFDLIVVLIFFWEPGVVWVENCIKLSLLASASRTKY